LGTIDLPFRRGGVLECRAIVPNGSPTTHKRRRLTAVRLFYLSVRGVSGSDRLGTIDLPFRRGGVLECRAIVPNGSTRRASGGVLRLFGCFILLSAGFSGSDRLGTIDLPFRRGGVLVCRAIVPNGSTRRASGGVLRLFGCFILPSAVVSGSDRLGTIDLPSTICTRRTKSRCWALSPGGADRPEAYPTGNEKSEAYSTVNENRQADVELDRLILQEG
jgi:hypothetical protein